MPRATFGSQLAALRADLTAQGLVDASPPLIVLTDRNVKRVARQTQPLYRHCDMCGAATLFPGECPRCLDMLWHNEAEHDDLWRDECAELDPGHI